MTHPRNDQIYANTSIEDLVREFFASDFDSPPAVVDDFFSGTDVSSLLEAPRENDDAEDEVDPVFTEVTQRALLHIPVSEAELDKRLNTDTK
jgi:hypothetical protein